ncbi:hypothetical protein [Parapedobacter sp. DT-150]|uniref:hypothetical protein n=1 Tax=Parapedobacter sp. DT-150 TaxID=3396162 RepID=UPI003F1A9978
MSRNTFLCLAVLGGLAGLFSACRSARISSHFAQNGYLPLYDNVVYNDALSLLVPSFGDVAFERDVKTLRRLVRNIPLATGDSLVLWGSTQAPPFYSFALTVNDACADGSPNSGTAVLRRDTCINGRRFGFFGFAGSEEDVPSVEKDLISIWNRLTFDSLWGERLAPMFSITEIKTNKLYEVLNNVQQYPTHSDQDWWTKTQLILTYASFLGDNAPYRQALEALEQRMMSDSVVRQVLDHTPAVTGNAVLDVIATEARNRQLVMINENHFYPNHRLLVADLLDSLHAVGYRYLALEALDSDQEEAVNTSRQINLKTGFYTQEQQYARLIRKALVLGFTLVAYENTDPAKDREEGQAENLFNKTFAQDPTAKVLVLAGMDHILETPAPNGKKWMAALFKERYGIDPLTISQNDFKHLRHLAPKGYLMLKSEAFDGDRLRAVDYQIINSRPVATIDPSQTLVYRNRSRDSVQVLLFLSDKPVSTVMATELPYVTAIVPGKSKTRLPVVPGKPALIVVYDSQGRRVK